MNSITDEDILKDIIDRLAEGVLPWRRPWSNSADSVVIGSMEYSARMWPSNLRAPKIPFGVFNGTILLAHASKQGYRSNLWITEGAIDEVRADLHENDDQPVAIRRYVDEHSPYRRSKLGVRRVYNIDQVKDCEKKLGLAFSNTRRSSTSSTRYEHSEKLLKKLIRDHGLRIVNDNRAAYSPSWDTVMMPVVDQFNAPIPGSPELQDGAANYWSTLWHEVVHWTGHPSRLNRERHQRWGDRKYAFEELIAELGAAFLCAHLGVDGELQHESYLEDWSSALKQDRAQSLWTASTHATKAKEFILDAGEKR